MGEEVILSRINSLLSGTDYQRRVANLGDIRNFLGDPKNQRYGVYDEVDDLYSLLVLGPGMW